MTSSDLRASVGAFQALARSSPWRWRTLHFEHRNGDGDVEAWLRRPGDLVVRTPDGRRHRIREEQRGDNGEPVLGPDGLVTERRHWLDGQDEPMWQNYSWVAMLDPVELSHHVEITRLREELVAGRRAWRADLRALPGYDPRCGGNCCELLYSEAGLHADFWDDLSRVPDDARGRRYPDHYDAALDVETGIVVRLHPVGGDDDAPWLENDILDVDTDLDQML